VAVTASDALLPLGIAHIAPVGGLVDGADKARYKKIVADPPGMDHLLVEVFLEAFTRLPKRIWLELDATDDPLHGNQEGRFYYGYYRHYCYLPLYIICGEHLLGARLRPSNLNAAAASVELLQHIVEQIRSRWLKTQIIIRGESGFRREEIMIWCEANRVEYLLGLAKNARIERRLIKAQLRARTAINPPPGRPGVRSVCLPDPHQLEPLSMGHRQGRAPVQRPQCALRGHQPAAE